MQEQGMPLREIRATIDKSFSPFGPATLTDPAP